MSSSKKIKLEIPKLSVIVPKSNSIKLANSSEIKVDPQILIDSPIPENFTKYIPIEKELKIIIDNYIFYPLGRFKASRELVLLKSINITSSKEMNIYLYRSNSEGGLFRFCSKTEDKFEKGSHYIVDTFVHMDLQQFLIENFNHIPIIDIPIDYCPNTIQYFSNYNSRIYPTPSLDILNICNNLPEFHCLTIDGLKNFLGIDTSDYKFAEVNMKYSIEPYITEFREIANKYLHSFGEREYTFNNLSRIYYLSLSTYLKKYIKLIEPIRPSFLYKDTVYIKPDKYPKMTFKNKYYAIDILIEDKLFTLILNKYYIKFYNISKESNSLAEFSDKEHCIITNIIPKEAKVNKYGTYDKIVNAGSLIYKPVEYIIGCDVAAKCNLTYTFIGHILENIYPVYEICKYI